MHSDMVVKLVMAVFGLVMLVWLLRTSSKRYKEAEKSDNFEYRWLLAEEAVSSGVLPLKTKISEATKLVDIIEAVKPSPFVYHLYNRKRNCYTKLTFIRTKYEDEFILRFYDTLVKYYSGSNNRIKDITISLKRHHKQNVGYTIVDFYDEGLSRIEITVNPERVSGATLALIVASTV